LPLSSLLGLKRGDGRPEAGPVQPQRAFKGAEVAPFAANIALVAYACDGADDDVVVELVVNERRVPVPGLDCIFCPIADVRAHFGRWTTQFFDQICLVE